MRAIDVHGLVRTFESGRGSKHKVVEAVRGIDLTVEAGERIAYIGPNGAGKSTSIKVFTGILHPSGGHVRVLGFEPWTQRRALASRIGVLFGQRSQLWSELTARRSLYLLGAIYRIPRSTVQARVEEIAELLDARDLLDQPARTFSLGQRMRCELAAAMLHRPEILFLDEPTIGLDLVAKRIFRDLVSRLNAEQGTTVFLTSHDVADIEAVARRVVVINHGTVIYDDTVDEMRRSLLATKVVDVRFDRPTHIDPIEHVELLEASADACTLRVDTRRRGIRSVLDTLLDQYEVADISVVDPPLEDVIGEIYAGRL
jgi:ABC-2 type transport system ATP-binding protein